MLGYDLSEEEEQILSRQMNLLLSYEKEGFEDIHLLDPRLAAVEQAAANVSSSSMFIGPRCGEVNHLKPVIRYEIKISCRWIMRPKASLDLVENARSGKKGESFLAFG